MAPMMLGTGRARAWAAILGFTAAAIVVAAGVVVASRHRTGEGFVSPQDRGAMIRFSHRTHIEDVGASCLDCHGEAASSTSSSDNLLGNMATCYTCHDESTTDCDYCHKEPGPDYTSFVIPERDILFSHQAHLKMDLSCEDCHPAVEEVDYTGVEQWPVMADCTACHDGSLAAGECAVCHSDVDHLRPASHTAQWLHRHNTQLRIEEQDCGMCHRANDCQECHQAAPLVPGRALPQDHFAPFAPSAAAQSKPLILQRAHELDYRYTHGLDARGKERDCQVCHEPSTFCAECHRPEGDLNRFAPAWHGGPDWGTGGGVGSGGGRHAALARRDIENCAACHDVQGEDPACLQCHMDRQPGKGNDPRTHEPGYMRDVKGPWHSDLNETCYACHRPSASNAPGFCTYCHGPKRAN